MVRNTNGLKHSAQSRSEDAMQRATAAILQMQSEEAEINFRSVAARAKVSTAWLYAGEALAGQNYETAAYFAGYRR
jgi:hypothetical protein